MVSFVYKDTCNKLSPDVKNMLFFLILILVID